MIEILNTHDECYMKDKCAKYTKCPMVLVQDIISGKWKILILWYLSYSTLRFSDLQKKLPTVSQKVLSRQLKSMEEDNIINRKVYPVVPPKVEYSLTDTGRKLIPLLEMMHKFGAEYLEESFEA
ncbi:helix-turn-helix transcriptional regulator [Clostridium sp. NSJ-6]|uniref:Helix-turn-helix transcriptional regulator n=1 Tax=Clostridium hominis TaxID=2763036 RepID=A0ABR7DBJ8_9CLOT|nr:helix-turn-helix domain-containing protein [Clostridium hominis]MBC5628785.1 helix-turn-helix transcriptional regulator [Clostridium hominis]MDU2671660.1 helix-turn-helix domain-containing protein [Clostridium sp.]